MSGCVVPALAGATGPPDSECLTEKDKFPPGASVPVDGMRKHLIMNE